MADIDGLLKRWQRAGVLSADSAELIRAYERDEEKPGGLKWQGLIALILGAILLACGVALFVSAHWDELGPGARYAIVIAMVAVFHLGGGLAREHFKALSTTLHAVGTLATGAAIALVGRSSTSRSIGRERCCCGRWLRLRDGCCCATRRNKCSRCCWCRDGFSRS